MRWCGVLSMEIGAGAIGGSTVIQFASFRISWKCSLPDESHWDIGLGVDETMPAPSGTSRAVIPRLVGIGPSGLTALDVAVDKDNTAMLVDEIVEVLNVLSSVASAINTAELDAAANEEVSSLLTINVTVTTPASKELRAAVVSAVKEGSSVLYAFAPVTLFEDVAPDEAATSKPVSEAATDTDSLETTVDVT